MKVGEDNTDSSRFSPKRSSPSPSASSSMSPTASRSSGSSSVSEKPAGGEEGGKSDDCDARRRRAGDPALGGEDGAGSGEPSL